MATSGEQRASESAIRALIERWAKAVHAGDLDGVLADHSGDIQMFDVPPPNEIRDIGAYRETWPPSSSGRGGARSRSSRSTSPRERRSPSALLRFGTDADLARDPDDRLRLTIGLRKECGRWSSRTSITRSRHTMRV
jgi:SnoaL-like domain